MSQSNDLRKWVNRSYNSEVVRFGLVGVLNTLIGTSVMFVAYNVLGCGYWISSALNYILGSIFSYFANKLFTFKSQEKSLKEIMKFVVNILICYLAAYGFAKPVTLYIVKNMMNLSLKTKVIEQMAMIVGMICFVFLNYFGQKIFVFSKDNKNKG